MGISERLEKLMNEEVYRLCKNYSNSNGNCMITCHAEDVMLGDKCPFQKENERKCGCFKNKVETFKRSMERQ